VSRPKDADLTNVPVAANDETMVRSVLLLAVISVLLAVGPVAEAAPPNPYAAASAMMANASSMRVGMTFTLGIGGHSLSYSAHGVQFPRRHDAAMQVNMSKLEPSLGSFQEVGFGHYVYMHLPGYQSLKRRDPRLKPWVSLRVAGPEVSPLSGAASFNDLSDIVAVGRAVDAGVPVERYHARMVLAHALGANPALQGLLARVGSLRSLFEKPLPVRFDVGDDGYLRGVAEAFTFSLPNGVALSIKITEVMSGFDVPMKAITPPSRDEIMTYKQFQQQLGGAVSLPVVV
jgi:hypothetical protein